MRTSHQLKRRINLILVFVAALPVFIMALFMRNEAAGSMDRLIRNDLANMTRMIDYHLAGRLSDAYDAAVATLAADGFADALAASDRTGLENVLLPLFDQLKTGKGLSILEAGDAKGIVLYRAHEPSLYGDDKHAAEAYRYALRGQPYAGIFAGKHGMGLRIILPVVRAGTLIGTLQAGYHFDPDFLSEMGMLVGDRIAVFDRELQQVAPLDAMLTKEETASLLPDLQRVLQEETIVFQEAGEYRVVLRPITAPSGLMPAGVIHVGKLYPGSEAFDRRIWWMAMIASLLSILVILLLTRRLGRSVHEGIRDLSFHDTLTGMYNRAYFEEELSLADQNLSLPVACVMGDANGLKQANDRMGHDAGDLLLKEIAAVLRANVREGDVLARWGGDEFVILFPRTGPEEAKRICDRIEERSASPEKPGVSRISLGFAVKGDEGTPIRDVLREAEMRMYERKRKWHEAHDPPPS